MSTDDKYNSFDPRHWPSEWLVTAETPELRLDLRERLCTFQGRVKPAYMPHVRNEYGLSRSDEMFLKIVELCKKEEVAIGLDAQIWKTVLSTTQAHWEREARERGEIF